jgi:hypothetical protein
VSGLSFDGPASGERMLVNVMLTKNGSESPEKYDDCEGVMTTRTGESSLLFAAIKSGI